MWIIGGLLMEEIIVYSLPNCGGCELVKGWLKQNGKEFKEINVKKDIEALRHVKSKGFESYPVIEKGDFIFLGYDEEKLNQL